ncbi:MAG: hypothetical protein HY074_02310 [Deltaproteobacteria bacterium]|nr:hypothetical protein [Deltaproteobacteria bacterium]
MSKIKNRKLTTSLLSMLATPFVALSVHADYCPPAPTSVVANVVASVKWDPQIKLYTYSYKVQNSNSSPIPLKRFLVLTSPEPANIQSPNQWHSDFEATIGKTDWITSAPDPNTKNLNVKGAGGGHLLPAFYAIKPGASLSGFSFQSPNPPAATKFMVAGDTDIPASTPTSTDDEPAPNCPGWYFKGPKYETMGAEPALTRVTRELPPSRFRWASNFLRALCPWLGLRAVGGTRACVFDDVNNYTVLN